MNRLYELLRNNTGPAFTWNVSRNTDPCSWDGVFCSPSNLSVTHLSLSSISLNTSDFLPVFCQIESLESLNISNNHLGSIPDEFFSACSGLKALNFSRNLLIGSLPNFTGFLDLEHLDFSHNSLRGNVDFQIGGLSSLKSLNLENNKFNGPVPRTLGNSTLLEELSLSGNNFTGQIPQELVNCVNLTLVDFSDNRLIGTIPQILGRLSRLSTLILSSNQFTGEIPQFISNMDTLSRFAANQNRFTGVIPLRITRFLKNIDLSYNRLNGSIPFDFLSRSNLEFVDLSFNFLEGTIPENISQSLLRLRLGNNSLNGTIPSLGNLQNLTYLELDSNKLTGSIPAELGLCTNLALVNLADNQLVGVLPREFGNLTRLQVMRLEKNNLSGEIPTEITNLRTLQIMNISFNSLSGSIPSSISYLINLRNLDLRGNNLTGSLPISIRNLDNILELQLADNKLTGAIRSLPASLQISLNLSHNLFEGRIPGVLSGLTDLEVLDLSNNQFNGEIPNFLTTMVGLTHVILSNNRLSGLVPIFRKFVNVETLNNTALVYPTNTSSPPPQNRSRRVAPVVVIAAAISGVIAVGLITVIILTFSRRIYRVNEYAEPGPTRPEIIEGVLLTRNVNHISSINYTTAMEAVTQNSNIFLKTRFSTYYKAKMPNNTRYTMKRINWSDKIFQLGSQEKFKGELEILGKMSNSSVCTPLAYVLTADNAYLFYEYAEKGTLSDVLHDGGMNVLDWSSRYSIAIGVAQGLTFLHGSVSGPVLLMDLSSKNIFLKSLKEPQIGDIELCKVIDPSKSTGSLSAIAGSVGYIPAEYAYTMRVTMAGNVYSFGVILLELVAGKPAMSNGTELAKWALTKSMQKEKWDHILDYSISRTSVSVRNQMLAVLKIALSCVSVSADARPKMKSVLRMLLNAR
jgi:Leucine-rich repeat (LRR) protein